MSRSPYALCAFALSLGVALAAHAQPTVTPKPADKPKVGTQVLTDSTLCKSGSSPLTGTFKATKITLIPVDKEEGGDCNQAHLWVEALKLTEGGDSCTLTFGVYVGDAKPADTQKKIAQMKAGPFKGTVDYAGMCYPEFSAR